GELRAILALLIQAYQAPLLAIAIYILLRHDCTQPTFERSASGVRSKLRDAHPISRICAVQIGVKRIRQLAGCRTFLSDISSNVVQLHPVSSQEDFPRAFMARGAGARQRQFLQPQPANEITKLAM